MLCPYLSILSPKESRGQDVVSAQVCTIPDYIGLPVSRKLADLNLGSLDRMAVRQNRNATITNKII